MSIGQTILSPGYQRPRIHVPSQQRVVCVLDDSGSMSGEKGTAAVTATRELCAVLGLPSKWNAFAMSVIGFARQAKIIHDFEQPAVLAKRLVSLKLGRIGGKTNVTSGLE